MAVRANSAEVEVRSDFRTFTYAQHNRDSDIEGLLNGLNCILFMINEMQVYIQIS